MIIALFLIGTLITIAIIISVYLGIKVIKKEIESNKENNRPLNPFEVMISTAYMVCDKIGKERHLIHFWKPNIAVLNEFKNQRPFNFNCPDDELKIRDLDLLEKDPELWTNKYKKQYQRAVKLIINEDPDYINRYSPVNPDVYYTHPEITARIKCNNFRQCLGAFLMGLLLTKPKSKPLWIPEEVFPGHLILSVFLENPDLIDLIKLWKNEIESCARAYVSRANDEERIRRFQRFTEPFQSVNNTEDFDVLGIKETSDFSIIKSAYRALASKYHPDKHTRASAERIKMNEERMKEINRAYRNLEKRYA